MKNWFISLLLIFNFSFITGQINFSSIPSEKQLIGRNLQTNLGTITIEGNVNIGDNYDLDFSS